YQVDDGTVFYLEGQLLSIKRLYVKWSNREINANLLSEEMSCHGAHGNAIYLELNRKFYKAVFSPSDGIVVSYVRDRMEGERVSFGICQRSKDDGTHHVYRICEDPFGCGADTNISDYEFLRLSPKGLHRDKVIYHSLTSESSHVSVSRWSENVILIHCDLMCCHATDSNRLVYITCDKTLYTLDTETMTFLPPLRIEAITLIEDIVGVHNDVVTLKTSIGLDEYLMSTQLPAGFVMINSDYLKSQKDKDRIECERIYEKYRDRTIQSLEKDSEKEIIERGKVEDGRIVWERIQEDSMKCTNNRQDVPRWDLTIRNSVGSDTLKWQQEEHETVKRYPPRISNRVEAPKVVWRDKTERERIPPIPSHKSTEKGSFELANEEQDAAILDRKISEVTERLKRLHAETEHVRNSPRISNGNDMPRIKGMEEIPSFESEFLKKFKPRRILGQGSFGCVFKAKNLLDNWSYAVKRIPLRGSEESVNDALKELRTLASLRHEGIVGYNSSWVEKPPRGWQKNADAKLLKKFGQADTLNYKDDCVF
ncbi:hypothetical protein PENTCL1PPCAC_23948, partial [Pristionchus entomophagus]